jgi:hypothetical protein
MVDSSTNSAARFFTDDRNIFVQNPVDIFKEDVVMPKPPINELPENEEWLEPDEHIEFIRKAREKSRQFIEWKEVLFNLGNS